MTQRRLPGRRLLLGSIVVLIPIIAAIVYVASQPNSPSATPKSMPTIVFDFDTGSPLLAAAQRTPFSQTANGVTAQFSSSSDPAAFSVHSYDANGLKLSQFSGKYLYDNKTSSDILDIEFSTEIIEIKFTFATVELQGGAIILPSDIVLAAYKDTKLVGSSKTYGSFSSDSYPQGTLSFGSGLPFNCVRISVPPKSSGATDFLVDNITVTTISKSSTP